MPNYEGVKFLCAQNILTRKANNHNTNSSHHDISLNRLLKHCCSFLNGRHDTIVVHDPNMPCIDEKLMNDLCQEAFKHGAACISTSENIKNSFVKIEESDIEETEEFSSNEVHRKNMNRSFSTSGALVSDFLELNYRICFKPQAFKYSIFMIVFENVTKKT